MLFFTLFILLTVENMRLKENRCKFKIDQITYSNCRSLEQRMTIAKISLRCILNNEGCKKTSLATV